MYQLLQQQQLGLLHVADAVMVSFFPSIFSSKLPKGLRHYCSSCQELVLVDICNRRQSNPIQSNPIPTQPNPTKLLRVGACASQKGRDSNVLGANMIFHSSYFWETGGNGWAEHGDSARDGGLEPLFFGAIVS